MHTGPREPLRLSEATGVPFYRQIVQQLSDQIRSGGLQPGERLPSVRELAAELVVSLITTRRAYAELEAEGLIVRRQGQGTFVREAVEQASRRQARREVERSLGEALQRGRHLGFDDDQLRELVDEILKGGEA
ncbi:MAG: GntR family transcriptional regulator [Acidobacteriota bacterium]